MIPADSLVIRYPITSSIPLLPPAVTTSETIIMHWPMQKVTKAIEVL